MNTLLSKKTSPLLRIFLFSFFVSLFTPQAHAIPAPDIIMQLVSNVAIYFAIGVTIVSTVFSSIFLYIKNFYHNTQKKYIYAGIIIGVILSLSLLSIYVLDVKKQEEIKLREENINTWLQYKKIDTTQNLSYDEKVEILLKLTEQELGLWLFGKEVDSYSTSSITNTELKEIISSENSQYTILDARENIEYEMGNIPGSIHHRVADLKFGDSLEKLQKDITYVIVCWSGVRGKLVSEFLLHQGYKTVYLEHGVEGWTQFNGMFQGETELTDVFKNSNYNTFINSRTFQELSFSGGLIIDAREENRLNSKDILPSADSISMMYIALPELQKKLGKYTDELSPISVVCDDYVNCFDAQLLGIELEKRNANFKGIYFKK